MKTHCKHGHLYTAANTRWVTDKSNGRRFRTCLTCKAEGERRRNRKRNLAGPKGSKRNYYGEPAATVEAVPADLILTALYEMELEFWQRRHAAKMQIVRRELNALRERRPTFREMLSFMAPRQA